MASTRNCSDCGGTGFKRHAACGGRGCKTCDWTGFYGKCPRCKGTGRRPNGPWGPAEPLRWLR